MRHGVGYRKFQKSSAHTRALFRNLATSLLQHEQIETTVEKAKELRPIVERLITRAKDGSLASKRFAYDYLNDKAVVHKLFADVAPRFISRPGGYTRVLRTRHRDGDRANMAIIELVERAKQAAVESPKAA